MVFGGRVGVEVWMRWTVKNEGGEEKLEGEVVDQSELLRILEG